MWAIRQTSGSGLIRKSGFESQIRFWPWWSLRCLSALVKPPLSTASAASCNGPVHLFVCLFVCLSPKYKNEIFSKAKQFRAMVSIDWLPIGSRTWAFQRTHYCTPKIRDVGDPPSWKSTWRHFFLLRVVRFGWNFADCSRMTCRLRWYSRNRNQK